MLEQPLEKIRWRSHRGMLELDLLLLPFVDHVYCTLSDKDKKLYIKLLSASDPELYAWLLGHESPENKALQPIIKLIQQYQAHSA